MSMVRYLFTSETLTYNFRRFVNEHVRARCIIACEPHTSTTSRNRCNETQKVKLQQIQ